MMHEIIVYMHIIYLHILYKSTTSRVSLHVCNEGTFWYIVIHQMFPERGRICTLGNPLIYAAVTTQTGS